jgi:thioredoxin-related protein
MLLFPAVAAEKPSGAYLGARSAESPHWFKDSFLEFEADVAEAAQQNKRVMLYFHQHGCPYCARLVEENFADSDIEAYVRQHFDGIQLNMWGDREIVSVGGREFTEKSFAEALKVQYTPTVIFLDEEGKVALRLNGYYPKDKFRLALRYVAEKRDLQQSFNTFVLAQAKVNSTSLREEDFFLKVADFQTNRHNSSRPLAVYFEAPDCQQCNILHDKVLVDAPTRKLVEEMDNVQINIHSDQALVTPSGEAMTQKQFATELNIGYTPSVVFFDSNANEVFRIEGFVKTFHFQSVLAYVLEKAYLSEPSFQRYISARGEKLREMGFDTDIWGYESAYPATILE